MPARSNYAEQGHLMVIAPTAGSTLPNAGSRSTGGLEDEGSYTSTIAVFTCQDTLTAACVPPPTPVPGLLNDGTETCATPIISITNITIPSSYKGDSLSHNLSIPNNSSAGTFDIFPNVKWTVGAPVGTPGPVTGSLLTTATAPTGSCDELDTWVSPWNDPSSSTPEYNGSDFATTKSAGYARDNGIFEITVEVTFKLKFDGPDDFVPTHTQVLEFKIGVINNYDNDRDNYLQDYSDAYGELSEPPQ